MQKKANLFIIIGYIGITFTLLAGTLFCKPDTRDERRRPAEFPDIKQVTYQQLCVGLDRYFNDHFGFRNQFLSGFKFVRNRVFKLNSQISVISGSDGWFFLRRCVDGYTGKEARINDDQCRQVANLISQTAGRLADKGIPFYFVVVPDKAVVYEDFLPDWAQKSQKPSIKQKILTMLAQDSNVRVIDLEQPMMQARKSCEQNLYYKVDTHWNAIGAYEGYSAIISQLNEHGLNIDISQVSSYSESIISDGDLSGLVGEFKLREDIKYEPQFANPIELNVLEYDAINGNPKLIKTDNPQAKLTLFMIRDSFTTDMAPHFAQSFRACSFNWTKNIGDSMSLIEQDSPDIVILETIERYLYQLYEENFDSGHHEQSDF